MYFSSASVVLKQVFRRVRQARFVSIRGAPQYLLCALCLQVFVRAQEYYEPLVVFECHAYQYYKTFDWRVRIRFFLLNLVVLYHITLHYQGMTKKLHPYYTISESDRFKIEECFITLEKITEEQPIHYLLKYMTKHHAKPLHRRCRTTRSTFNAGYFLCVRYVVSRGFIVQTVLIVSIMTIDFCADCIISFNRMLISFGLL